MQKLSDAVTILNIIFLAAVTVWLISDLIHNRKTKKLNTVKSDSSDSDVHIKSDDLCDRCIFGDCGVACKKSKPCQMDNGALCRCDSVQYGTPCEYFEEVNL